MKKTGNSENDGKRKFSGRRLCTFLYIITSLSFIVPIVFAVVMLVTGDFSENQSGYHSSADYTLMIVQCLLGLVSINLANPLARAMKFELPWLMYSLFIVFLYCSIFLGEVRSYYYRVHMWDSILHTMSSLMTGCLGFMLVTIINRDEHITLRLSPAFVAVFAFCFSVTVGTLWEIYEFTFDGLLHMNMQKFITADGDVLVGRSALADTMKDLIIDCVGALVSSIIGFLALRKNKRWLVPSLVHPETEKGGTAEEI